MQPANGTPNGTRDMLDTVKQLVDQLQAELKRHEKELQRLRAERDDYRAVVIEHLKKKFDPKVWDNFNPNEFAPQSIAAMIADLKVD